MRTHQISERDQALTSEDLAVCQRVLDAVKAEFHSRTMMMKRPDRPRSSSNFTGREFTISTA